MGRPERAVATSTTIDLNRVATWVQVVDSGSFTAAARALGLPKSSVSRSIQRLEQELGLSLLSRTTRKLTLTPAGERYLVSAREALRMLAEARAEVLSADGEPRGLVRITAPLDPTSRIGGVLAGTLATFLRRYPAVHVDILFTGRQVDLVAERVDLAIRARAGKLDDSTLVARKIANDTLVLVASPSYLSEQGTPRRVADLARHRMILFNATGSSQRIKLGGPSGTESVTVQGPVNVNEMSFQLPLAEHGIGIALVPALLVELSVREGRLVHVLPQYGRREASIYLVYPAQRQVPKRVTLLRDYLYVALKRELSMPLI